MYPAFCARPACGPGEPMRTLVLDGFPVIFSELLPARLSALSERLMLV
jgi:hypothetical protein